ncbi:hypothetical protein [Bacillus sp. TL12]|uniref:hypothetical protein n=1 Tax=Bacillus sp. TL12 TaxID=2894756 RepID=UPI001F519A31|nr:hypothetical protein [Bacillus sp. TL12]MCI0766702.1 hypothetical protein [Bacillus sp. TL12]
MMKKLPIIACTLGLSLGLLGTSVVGAASDSSKSFVKEKISTVEQNNDEGVQPRWAAKVAGAVGGFVGGMLADSNALKSKAWSTNGSKGTNYASAGGMVGGHAPAADIPEFGI